MSLIQRSLSVLSLYAALWATGGCYFQEGDPYRMGILLNDEGRITMLYEDCGEPVEIFAVRSGMSKQDPAWLIESDSGSLARSFTLGGHPPPDFAEVIAMREQPMSGQSYFVSVDSSYLEDETYGFDPADLRPDRVLTRDRDYLDPEDFFNRALC